MCQESHLVECWLTVAVQLNEFHGVSVIVKLIMLVLFIVSQEISFFFFLHPQSDLIHVHLLFDWILKYLQISFQDLPYVAGQLPMNIQY